MFRKVLSIILLMVMIWTVSMAETLTIDLDSASEEDVGALIENLIQIRNDMIRERLAANPIQPAEKDTYTFRDVPWYSTKAQAESIMKLSSSGENKNIYKAMNLIEYPHSPSWSEVKGDTGVNAYYNKLNVAGYKAKTYLEFIYPIENGIIVRDPELAQLYLGYYWISSEDYYDIEAVFNDLENKLSSVYGNAIDASTESHSIRKWIDASDNMIVLVSSTYNLAIGYIAADAEKLVATMEKAVEEESLKKEEQDRLENSTNVDGL